MKETAGYYMRKEGDSMENLADISEPQVPP